METARGNAFSEKFCFGDRTRTDCAELKARTRVGCVNKKTASRVKLRLSIKC
jgi:hypothetical protein